MYLGTDYPSPIFEAKALRFEPCLDKGSILNKLNKLIFIMNDIHFDEIYAKKSVTGLTLGLDFFG